MARPREIPDGAEVIRKYAELRWFLQAFANNRFTLLIVVGRPGLSKSVSIKEIMKQRSICYIKGHARPIQVFIKLFEYRHQPIVLDDAEGLNEDVAGRNLLTSLAQTDAVKHLAWLSSTKILADHGVPMRFSTTSRACIITNRWSGSAKEIQALEDRGHLLYFDPTPDEVHRFVSTWFQRDAQDIYDFVGERLHLIDRPSCRLYVKALERKAAGGDWKTFIQHHCCQTSKQRVREILEDVSCTTEEERVIMAKERAGISRATYFRYKKKLNEEGQLPHVRRYQLQRIELKSEPPPPASLDDIVDEEPEVAVSDHENPPALRIAVFRET